MSEMIEQIKEWIEEREAKIKGNEGHIVSLQDENEQWKAEITGLGLALKLFRESEPQPGNGTPALIGKYANMGLTDAILDVVNTAGKLPGMTVREIVDALIAEGYKNKSKDLYNSVYPIAMGLVIQKRLAEGEKDGKRTFVRKVPINPIILALKQDAAARK